MIKKANFLDRRLFYLPAYEVQHNTWCVFLFDVQESLQTKNL